MATGAPDSQPTTRRALMARLSLPIARVPGGRILLALITGGVLMIVTSPLVTGGP